MINEVTICNLALSRIGEDGTIVSLDPPEGSEQAAACAAFYSSSLRAVLAAHDWRFATRRVEMSELADADTHGWRAAYTLPSDCLRVIDVKSKEDPRHRYRRASSKFEIESTGSVSVLYTDTYLPVVRYIVSDPRPGSFSPLFSDAVSWHLAGQLIGRVIKSKTGADMARYCLQQYQMVLAQAAVLDSTEKEMSIRHIPDWIEVR